MIDLAIEKFGLLLQGRIPDKIDTGKIADKSKQKFAEMLNQLIEFMQEIHNFIVPLSKGEIAKIKTSRNNFLASPFKELHSRLLHLTWQAQQIAKGDYSQRVEFMGDFSKVFNSMIISLHNKEKLLKKRLRNLRTPFLILKIWKVSYLYALTAKKSGLTGPIPKYKRVGYQ